MITNEIISQDPLEEKPRKHTDFCSSLVLSFFFRQDCLFHSGYDTIFRNNEAYEKHASRKATHLLNHSSYVRIYDVRINLTFSPILVFKLPSFPEYVRFVVFASGKEIPDIGIFSSS